MKGMGLLSAFRVESGTRPEYCNPGKICHSCTVVLWTMVLDNGRALPMVRTSAFTSSPNLAAARFCSFHPLERATSVWTAHSSDFGTTAVPRQPNIQSCSHGNGDGCGASSRRGWRLPWAEAVENRGSPRARGCRNRECGRPSFLRRVRCGIAAVGSAAVPASAGGCR